MWLVAVVNVAVTATVTRLLRPIGSDRFFFCGCRLFHDHEARIISVSSVPVPACHPSATDRPVNAEKQWDGLLLPLDGIKVPDWTC
jgi:hypothetical protein